MNNLSNLHYLKLPFSLFSSIPEIGKLTSLQELHNFEVKNEPGYRIGELKQMNNLQKLSINSLENVEDAQEASNAKLLDKRILTDLTIKWGSRSNSIDLDDEKVLDNLQPPSCLQKLRIEEYMGVRSVIWMNTADFISNLEIIELSNCSNWQTLPPFGQLRFLKSLHLKSMPKVERFDNKFHENDGHGVFPSLEVLYIDSLEELEDWFDAEVAAAGDMFPCLTKLYLIGCPKLQELPYLPPKLNNLQIYHVGWKTLNCCTISKLEELDVFGCPNITNIYLERIAELRLLKIGRCPKLISLEGHPKMETTENCQLKLSYLEIDDPSILLMELLRSITSLQELQIEDNDEVVSFPIEAERWFLRVSSSLRQLNFARLQSLQSLPSSLESLSSLENLLVYTVPQLRELPNLPPSLAGLTIMYVPQLRELPNLPPSLAKLYLKNLDNLDFLPSCLPSLSSLKQLIIMKIPRLQDLPDLPSSLEFLVITECHPDLMERYRRDEGSDWHKIAHIPWVSIKLL